MQLLDLTKCKRNEDLNRACASPTCGFVCMFPPDEAFGRSYSSASGPVAVRTPFGDVVAYGTWRGDSVLQVRHFAAHEVNAWDRQLASLHGVPLAMVSQ